jgi:hypothetical protein
MRANTIPNKPSKVTLAVSLLYLSSAIGLANYLIQWLLGGTIAGESVGHTEIVILLITTPMFFWLYYMIGKGRNWARIIVLIILIPVVPVSAFLVIQSLSQTPFSNLLGIQDIIVENLTTILYIVAMVFLFQRDSSDWFKAMKISQMREEKK